MIFSKLFLTLCVPALAWAKPLSNTCKAYPGSPAWPSRREWDCLDKKIDGRLIKPELPGGTCHEGQPNYDLDQCPNTAKSWRDYNFVTSDPVSVAWDNWSKYTCLPMEGLPCSGKGYPAYVANVTTAKHVQASVKFARKHNVRLIVKSSGHDFLGRSVASGALSIWTRHLDSVKFHRGQFKLSGSGKVIRGDAITAGGGAPMINLYNLAAQNNRTVVGGGGKTVSIGGFTTGGGHSILAPHYGLAADQVLEMEVVTPDGKILTVNEDRNKELFWALRGGGGSTFGVVTSITVMTHPVKKITMAYIGILTSPESPAALEVAAWSASQLPYLSDSGLSGYLMTTINSPPLLDAPGLPPAVAGLMGKTIILDTDDETLDKIFDPIRKTIKKRWPKEVTFFILTEKFDSFSHWYSENYDKDVPGGSVYLISRLLDKNTLTKNIGALTKALEPIYANGGWLGTYLVAGKGVINAKPRGGSNAVHPAWRKTHVLGIHYEGWQYDPAHPEVGGQVKDRVNKRFDELRKLTPNGGSYMNEGFPWEENWQQAFWGSNYNRLLKLKRKIDPKDVFWCHPCVGNEGWAERPDGRLCKA